MRSEPLFLLAALAMMASPASAESRHIKTDPLSLTAKGEPQSCLPNMSGVNTKPAGENVLMFQAGTNRWYRNELRGSCPGLALDRTLVFRNMTAGRHCDLDMFDVVDLTTGMRFGTCALGKFTPVEVPKGTRF